MIIPMSFPVIRLIDVLSRRADESGFLGRSVKVEGPWTFDLSTPALRQVQPWRVLTISAVLSALTTFLVLRSTRSTNPGGLPVLFDRPTARDDGLTLEMSTSSPSLFDTAF